MRYQYEQIDYHEDLPIKIFTQTLESFPYHWHEDVELLFVLEGSLEIRVNRDSYLLNERDIFLVNGNMLHFIKSKAPLGKTHVLALHIDSRYLKKLNINIQMEDKNFHLNSTEADKWSTYIIDEIKYLLANMMDLILNRKNLYQLKVEKLLLDLIVILLEHFEVPSQDVQKKIGNDHRLLEILKYMNTHCADSQLSLQNIADTFSLNPQYLSRYFKENVGDSFKKKLDGMRLNKSLMELKLTDHTIIEIALKYGFPDSKAYYRVFKEVLGITPMQYREQYKIDMEKNTPKDYLSINSNESLASLFKYLERKNDKITLVKSNRKIAIECHRRVSPIHRSFTRLLTFGYAAHALRKDFMSQLMQIQKEIGFEYIRFHGIFADQLLVYNEKPDGSYYFNFNHIDAVIDHLLEAAVKPFIEIGFMPKDMARAPDTIFWWDAYVAPPKKLDLWLELIEAFFKHLINRYGIAEVRKWYFEFWNEPEVRSFWSGTKEEFFNLYAESYKKIKAIDDKIILGGFGVINTANELWLNSFEAFAKENGIGMDFFSFHMYNLTKNTESDKKLLTELEKVKVSENPIEKFMKYGNVMLGDENHLAKSIDNAVEKIKRLSFVPDNIWITEWNGNVNSRDLLQDTCYMAAFITKTAVENNSKVNGMGYWNFTDIFEEFQLEQPLFHGGFGLMTYNGIKKAGYHAYYFLSKLGEDLVVQEEDLIVTKKGEDYQILLYNYSHPNKLYRTFDSSHLSQTDRYTVFENDRIKSFQLDLLGLAGEYTIKKETVNRQQGSSFDAWVEMGAPNELDEGMMNYLKAKAEPGIQIQQLQLETVFTLQTDLQPHEIQFIEVRKRY